MKLEVGMYVRTIKGKIARIDEVSERTGTGIVYHENWNELFPIHKNTEFYKENIVIKARHKVIELIEVGDYVNGKEVTGVFKHVIYLYVGAVSTCTITNEEIKSILTKEQFKANEYIV